MGNVLGGKLIHYPNLSRLEKRTKYFSQKLFTRMFRRSPFDRIPDARCWILDASYWGGAIKSPNESGLRSFRISGVYPKSSKFFLNRSMINYVAGFILFKQWRYEWPFSYIRDVPKCSVSPRLFLKAKATKEGISCPDPLPGTQDPPGLTQGLLALFQVWFLGFDGNLTSQS